ncbi:MAG: holin [Caulobacter sp.]|nr:holin [Caulobacter sp.]
MARPAKTPIAGTISAIPMLLVLCGAATSHAQSAPSDVFNNQVQVGDVFSQGTLNVVTVEEGVQQDTSASGNAVQVYADQADMSVTSNQTMAGSAVAQTVVDVSDYLGADSAVSTTALGNTSDVGINQGTVTGVLTQISTYADNITARTQIEGATAEAGDVVTATTAIANNQNLSLTNGAAGVRTNQTNGAEVLADGGTILQYVSGTAAVSGVAVGNNLSSIGDSSSAQRLAIGQTNEGALVQASKFTAYGNAQEAITSTTAVGNSANVLNEGPLLDVTSQQVNSAYVRSQSEGTAYQFGAAQVSAYGAGNTAVAGNSGAELVLDNTQWNQGGGVEVIATFAGTDGYDAYGQATAVGNDVTGYACSACTGTMSVSNSQTNTADVGATSSVTVGAQGARGVVGTATATGNNASFYVTRPGS